MEWRDNGIVLGARGHGETSLVVSLLTESHGRHAGLVKGGGGKAGRALYQSGNLVSCTWKARLEDQLGVYACELLDANAAALLHDAGRLAALTAACAVLDTALAEREPHPALYDATLALLTALSTEDAPPWAETYVRWELVLLAEMGFGLDLSACAATGVTETLQWVSPKSGRAVSAAAGAPYADRLLVLPAFLRPTEADPQSPACREDLRAGLRLTGYFLDHHVFAPHHRSLPPARDRLVERLVDRPQG